MNKYGPKARREISRTMQQFAKGELRSGPDRRKVKNYKQAVAIGISRARNKRYKVPGGPAETES